MRYAIVNNTDPRAMRVQGVGCVLATEAKNIKAGNSLMWNYGIKSEVISITKETSKTIWINERSESGEVYNRRMSKSRLVCILRP